MWLSFAHQMDRTLNVFASQAILFTTRPQDSEQCLKRVKTQNILYSYEWQRKLEGFGLQ